MTAGILDAQQKACDCLFQAYKMAGNSVEALANHELFKLLSDSLRNSENTRYITQLEMQYNFDKVEEKRLAQEQANLLIRQEKDARNKRVLMVLLILLLISLFVGYLIYQNYQIKKKSELELSLKNEVISKALQEKELLLREIHHRVKNNLQVISSLLRLQSRYVEDNAALNAISAGRSRVQSMALLHENLYQDDNFTGVNMQKYFDRLIGGLFSTLNVSPDKISLVKHIQSIDLDVDYVVPIGLITNELITNALKHAFVNQEFGVLSVRLYEDDHKLTLEVSDNGKGMSTDFFESKSTSFGHKLIKAFATKLHADLKVLNQAGTTVQLIIHDYRTAS
jgi:two-component sensor histidine kinase